MISNLDVVFPDLNDKVKPKIDEESLLVYTPIDSDDDSLDNTLSGHKNNHHLVVIN